MADPRIVKMAEVLIHYSLDIQPGDHFLMNVPTAAEPLAREAYRAALRRGAHVTVHADFDGFKAIRIRESSDDQLAHISQSERALLDETNKYLNIMGDTNTKNMSGADPEKMASMSRARSELGRQMMQRAADGSLNWCVTLFPTQAYAQDASMSLRDYEDFVYCACLLDQPDPVAGWKQVEREQRQIADYLNTMQEIHITAPGTDLRYNVAGRRWVSANGRTNFPDGEVFTGPVESSVNGTVQFTYPAIFRGNEVEGIRLTFRDGKVVEATAERGQNFLDKMLDTDDGARYVGEVAFGLNYGIQNFTHNILFDEKIGGTMHMALGASYPETGGVNKSGLHWDMICDLKGGTVHADGKLIYQGGRFALE
jgi:aminopeptidase